MRLKTLLVFVLASFLLNSVYADDDARNMEKHIEVSMRLIGHKVLLSAGDSTSRVLPITREDDRYKIAFDTEFELNNDILVSIASQTILETGIADGYIVEAENCETNEVVYSYEIGVINDLELATCAGRSQPKACYNLYFTLLDAPDKLSILRNTPPITAGSTEASQVNYSLLALIVVFLIGSLFYVWKKRRDALLNPHLVALGNFQFDTRNAELIIDHNRTDLSAKESDLLSLLYNSANNTVSRDEILAKVWDDQGDYVGRTLDVFISKLRKKLEADSNVKIVTVHGVGYKLVVND